MTPHNTKVERVKNSRKSKTVWSEMWGNIVSPELSLFLEERATCKKLFDGELLYGRGDIGNEIYGVRSGKIKLVAHTYDGNEAFVGLYSTGTWFGEVSIFDELPRPVSAYALGNVEVYSISASQLKNILEQNPIWYRDFSKVICYKLRLALKGMQTLYVPISIRIALRLLDLVGVYGRETGEGVVIDLKLPQEYLAQMFMLRRQTINKELGFLQRQGLIHVSREEIMIRSIEGLEMHIKNHGCNDLLEL